MIMKATLPITIFSFLLISACGGGGSSDNSTAPVAAAPSPSPTVYTGLFLDSAVEGLNYTTASTEGTTNSEGEFIYQVSENITFSIGDIQFPEVLADTVITPLNLFNTEDFNQLEVVNILRLLQSLDIDGDADNGIQISETAHTAATGLALDFSSDDFANQANDFIMESGGVYQQLISEEMAVYHFQQTLTTLNEQGIANCEKTHDSIGYYGYFITLAHNVSGRAEIIDDCTIKITEFNYDGGGPEVFFYGAIDHDYESSNAFSIGQKLNGTVFENDEFIIRLPNNKTLDDLNTMSVWCVDFNANFGQVEFSP